MILVLVEPEQAEPGREAVSLLSLEALTFARGLADELGGDVQAVVVGAGPLADPVLAGLGAQGISVVHHGQDVRLTRYAAAAWAAAVGDVIKVASPHVVIAAASPRGNEILAHVAARSGLPMAANCVSARGSGPFLVARQVMGGSALEEVRLDAVPALLTMAGHAIEPQPAPQPSTPAVRQFAPDLTDADLIAQVARVEAVASDGAQLATARVVVGGGRGVGGADQFGPLLELAEALGGVLGVSRVVTSLGWRPHHEQVGQTGSRISPDLYVACGISGAIQHWAGCSSAKTILAVNTDADAPMVAKAHYAVIGDLHEIIPAVLEELRARA